MGGGAGTRPWDPHVSWSPAPGRLTPLSPPPTGTLTGASTTGFASELGRGGVGSRPSCQVFEPAVQRRPAFQTTTTGPAAARRAARRSRPRSRWNTWRFGTGWGPGRQRNFGQSRDTAGSGLGGGYQGGEGGDSQIPVCSRGGPSGGLQKGVSLETCLVGIWETLWRFGEVVASEGLVLREVWASVVFGPWHW